MPLEIANVSQEEPDHLVWFGLAIFHQGSEGRVLVVSHGVRRPPVTQLRNARVCFLSGLRCTDGKDREEHGRHQLRPAPSLVQVELRAGRRRSASDLCITWR